MIYNNPSGHKISKILAKTDQSLQMDGWYHYNPCIFIPLILLNIRLQTFQTIIHLSIPWIKCQDQQSGTGNLKSDFLPCLQTESVRYLHHCEHFTFKIRSWLKMITKFPLKDHSMMGYIGHQTKSVQRIMQELEVVALVREILVQEYSTEERHLFLF